MIRNRGVKIVSFEDAKVYRLIEILGRKNPNINTVAKIKNHIGWHDTAEDVLHGALDALMFRFEISDSVKDEALRFIGTMRNFNNRFEVEKKLFTSTENEKARMKCNNIQFISHDVKVDIIKKVITEIENSLEKNSNSDMECPIIPVHDYGKALDNAKLLKLAKEKDDVNALLYKIDTSFKYFDTSFKYVDALNAMFNSKIEKKMRKKLIDADALLETIKNQKLTNNSDCFIAAREIGFSMALDFVESVISEMVNLKK